MRSELAQIELGTEFGDTVNNFPIVLHPILKAIRARTLIS